MRPPLRVTKHSHRTAVTPPLGRHVSDGELLQRLALHDTRALDLALSRNWTLVVDYIARITGSKDAAEDVAQRTFCQLWNRRARWNTAGSLRALLCRIARNYAVSEHRRTLVDARSAAVFFELNGPALAPVRDAAADDRLSAMIAREIGKLPARRREIVVLRCYHDLSYKEIAAVMAIAEQTVANQLSKALAALRTSLGGSLD